jgi:thiol-disulfide isomerase/thioredoxin
MAIVAIFLSSILGQFASSQASSQTLPASARLVFIDTVETCPNMDDLVKCRDQTAEEYRKSGAKVLRRSERDIHEWLKAAGRRFEEAEQAYRYIAFARSLDADMIGGVSYYVRSPSEISAFGDDAGPQFFGWGYNLRTCEKSEGIRMEENGTRIGARPIYLSTTTFARGANQVWSIQTKLTPTRHLWNAGPSRGSGYEAAIGVELEPTGNRVIEVYKLTPASRLGIEAGDLIVSLNGNPIANPEDANNAMGSIREGDTVDVTWKHRDRLESASVKPLNWNEFIYRKQSGLLGRKVPNLDATDINGREVSLLQFKGNIIVLNFWATWCGPCRKELPCLQLMSEALSAEPVIWLNVSVDEDEKVWRKYVSANCLSGVQIRAPQWARRFFVDSLPTTFAIDAKGVFCEYIHSDAASIALGMALDYRKQIAKREKEHKTSR